MVVRGQELQVQRDGRHAGDDAAQLAVPLHLPRRAETLLCWGLVNALQPGQARACERCTPAHASVAGHTQLSVHVRCTAQGCPHRHLAHVTARTPGWQHAGHQCHAGISVFESQTPRPRLRCKCARSAYMASGSTGHQHRRSEAGNTEIQRLHPLHMLFWLPKSGRAVSRDSPST